LQVEGANLNLESIITQLAINIRVGELAGLSTGTNANRIVSLSAENGGSVKVANESGCYFIFRDVANPDEVSLAVTVNLSALQAADVDLVRPLATGNGGQSC